MNVDETMNKVVMESLSEWKFHDILIKCFMYCTPKGCYKEIDNVSLQIVFFKSILKNIKKITDTTSDDAI